MRKKKVLIHSNHSKSNSGFGRHTKALLTHLHKTGKYDLVEYCTGLNWSNDALKNMPWKAHGTLPDSDNEWMQILQPLNPNEREIRKRDVAYGSHNIDRIIKQEKPDVYIGIEDIWAFNGYFDRKWWNKLHCIVHTTLDSLPILPDAISAADKIKNYYVWAKFAEKAMHAMGHKHVRTIHGAIESEKFHRLSDAERAELRKQNNIPHDAFVIGFVFRNQLRKSVVKLLQGFKEFCDQNPDSKAYLLLHTHWSEGWNIPERIKEIGVDPSRVLTTYVCRNCKQYEVKPFALKPEDYAQPRIDVNKGQNQPCPHCGSKNGQITANVTDGVSEEQLNEVYNLMDVYCHPFTSGGQELPIQEAKLTELITLVTNYSCGEDWVTPESGGFPLEWEEYREPGTEFIKASTFASSIAKQLKKIWKMKPEDRRRHGRTAREYVLDTCDIEAVGKAFEEAIDAAPFVEWDFDFKEPLKNPDYQPAPNEDDKEWLKDIYRNILLMYVKDDDKGLLDWLGWLKDGTHTRESILNYFRGLAHKLNQEQNKVDFGEFFDKNGKKRILFVIKESLGDCFMASSLFRSIKQQYPDHDLYIGVEPKYADVFLGNPYVHKILAYHPAMESELMMAGQGKNPGYVNVYMNCAIATQRQLNYLTNTNLALDLKGDELT
jgi:glycosyltransferase involved in cell wall biosynthesis